MPIKYFYGNEQYVKILGMPHGILFVAYIGFACLMINSKKWKRKDLLIVIGASIVPFGTFYVDWKYL